jgi:aminoglycoside phosphotransferase (APT) family kinase protein
MTRGRRKEWDAEARVDEALARKLVREQFPELAADTLSLLGEGWDTVVWLVDGRWVFRFPRREIVIAGLENEMRYLAPLADRLPLPVPRPTHLGEPTAEFRWPFYGAAFLPGNELADVRPEDDARAALGRPLGEFLRALHSVDLDAELPFDPVRRADMGVRLPMTRERLDEVDREGLWRAPAEAYAIVGEAAELPPATPAAVVHGDLHLRHLLLDDECRPAAVIDWIDLARSEPGVDFVLYWCTLPPAGRAEFRAAYGPVTDEQLLRGRVLSLFLCAVLALWGDHERVEAVKREAIEGLERTLID